LRSHATSRSITWKLTHGCLSAQRSQQECGMPVAALGRLLRCSVFGIEWFACCTSPQASCAGFADLFQATPKPPELGRHPLIITSCTRLPISFCVSLLLPSHQDQQSTRQKMFGPVRNLGLHCRTWWTRSWCRAPQTLGNGVRMCSKICLTVDTWNKRKKKIRLNGGSTVQSLVHHVVSQKCASKSTSRKILRISGNWKMFCLEMWMGRSRITHVFIPDTCN